MRESAEMYLETIYKLSKCENNVYAITIAKEMNFSKPSVTRALKLLSSSGFITRLKNNAIQLTQAGIDKAVSVHERHTVIAAFLHSLGVDAVTAESDACRIEHIVSQQTFECIKKFANRNLQI